MVDIVTLAVLGHSLSNVVGANAVPIAPTGVQAVAGDTRAVVNWTAPNQGQPTSYTVTASPGGATATVSVLNATITGLTNGVAYTFTVVATNSAGNSTASSASNSVTPTAAPGALSSITGLAAWFDAGQIAGPPANGASVTTWSGSSGNSESATQSSAANRPTFVSSWTNSKPALNFSGAATQQYLVSNLVALAGFGGGTFFVVSDYTSSTNAGSSKDQRVLSNYVSLSKDSGLNVDLFAGSGNAVRVINDNGSGASSAALSLSTPFVISITAPGFLYTSGTKTSQVVNALRSNGNPFWFGAYPPQGGKNLQGDIAEILYFNRALTDAERHQVEAYLGTKYNITMAVQ